MITITSSGSFKKTESFLHFINRMDLRSVLDKYGAEGVDALALATPIDSGLTAASWTYEVVRKGSGWSIIWSNSHVQDGFPVAIMLQFGHGTGTGGYVQGQDYINPTIKPIFDRIENEVWKAVTSA
jgi:hypothetical protein